MNTKHLLVLGASMLVSATGGHAAEPQPQYLQMAEIEIVPGQLDAYKAAVQEHIATATREEPGVLVLYAVTEKDRPDHVRVFEVYRDEDAYKAHLEAPHFKKYKAVTAAMVKSLKLIRTSPIMLGSQSGTAKP